jgi:hypothetical protein
VYFQLLHTSHNYAHTIYPNGYSVFQAKAELLLHYNVRKFSLGKVRFVIFMQCKVFLSHHVLVSECLFQF